MTVPAIKQMETGDKVAAVVRKADEFTRGIGDNKNLLFAQPNAHEFK